SPGSTLAVQPPPSSPQGTAPPPPAAPPPNRLRGVIVRALIVGLAVLAGGLYMVDWDDLLLLSPVQRTDDAYLRGDPTTLSERDRQDRLRGTPAYLLRTWEKATQNALALQATVAGNRATIASQTAQLNVFRATFQQTEADLRAKQAALETAQINLGYTRVLAP